MSSTSTTIANASGTSFSCTGVVPVHIVSPDGEWSDDFTVGTALTCDDHLRAFLIANCSSRFTVT